MNYLSGLLVITPQNNHTLCGILYHHKFLFMVLLLVLSCKSQKPCPLEKSPTFNCSQVTQWFSNGTIENELVFSQPPCIDHKQNMITRICSNGTWIPLQTPTCQKTINNNQDCPQFLIETKQCTLITDPAPWGTRCSLNNNITKSIYSKNSRKLLNNTMWLPLKRKVNFGPYEFVSWGEQYGRTNFNISGRGIANFFEKNCVVYNVKSGVSAPEYCHKKHHHICPFLKGTQFDSCPKNCISAGWGTSQCYCKQHGTTCQNLAAVKNPFDKTVLGQLCQNDLCLVSQENFYPGDAQKQVISQNLWAYTGKSVNHSICLTKSLNPATVQMVLSFEEADHKLYLLVYSPEGVVQKDDAQDIYCFTDASDYLKKKVAIKQIFKYQQRVKERSFSVYQVEMEKYIGRYWCEAHVMGLSDDVVYSNKVLAYKRKKGHEYSLRVVVKNTCNYYPSYCNLNNNKQWKFLDENITNVFSYLDSKIRVMEVFDLDLDKNTLDYLLHISTNKRGRNVIPEYHKLKSKLKKLPDYLQVIYFKSSEFCLPNSTTEVEGKTLSWPLANFGESVTPQELCADVSEIPPTRVCSGSFLHGAEWSQVRGKCSGNYQPSQTTTYLKSVLESNMTSAMLANVTTLTQNQENLTMLDMYYLAKILKNVRSLVSNETTSVYKIIKIISSLLKVSSKTLKTAQVLMNVTDEFLDQIEEILPKLHLDEEQVFTIMRENIIVHITNPFLSNVSGLALISKNNQTELKNLKRNETFEDLEATENIKLALFVPETVLEHIAQNFGNLSNIHIVTTIYLNDKMFSSKGKKSVGEIVSVKIPGYGSYLTTPIPILFKPLELLDQNHECGFWDYGKRTRRKKGKWSDVGGNYLGNFLNQSNLQQCSFSHLTHFALLILEEKVFITNNFENDATTELILNILTFIGGILTIIGVAGIFLTAAMFDEWRKKQGTSILLHISLAILLESISTQLIEVKDIISSNLSCLVLGMGLHYLVLCKFCWMLIYAFLQYLRFVKVLGPIPKHLIFKSIVIGWGVPIVPVLIVRFISPYSYSSEDYHLCYPRGWSLYLGILLPIFVVVATNLVIFCIVMYQVSSKKIQSHASDSHRRQLQLATLLFFMLGLPYIFGLLAGLLFVHWLKMIFIYFFCLTATLQGFILFLFYVVFNNETRNKWKKYLLHKRKT